MENKALSTTDHGSDGEHAANEVALADQSRTTVTILRELYDFLMGVGSIDGTWFSELNDNLPGRYWWRALLRTADRDPSLKSTVSMEVCDE